jgi:hypothetical protein
MKKIKLIDGWTYEIDYKSIPPSFNIIPNEEYIIPETLYKYLPLEEKPVKLFEEFNLYATHPEKLNDPLDCAYNLFKYYDESVDFFIKQYDEMPVEEVKENYNKDPSEAHRSFLYNCLDDGLFKIIGIVALTGHISSLPMWAYYASQQEGFALGYNAKKLKEEINMFGPFPVQYKKTHDRPNFKDFRQENPYPTIPNIKIDFSLAMLYCSNIKSIQWEQENEWRFLCRVFDETGEKREKPYSKSTLDEIVFGIRFFISNKRERGIGINEVRKNRNVEFNWSNDAKKRFKKAIN